MGKAHQNQRKTAQPKSETNAIATQKKINTINRKQTPETHWTYGIQLRGTASNSNMEILQRFQSKTFRSTLKAPWYINNHRTHEDLQTNTVLSEIKKWKSKYLRKLENHTNAKQ
jgi:hypothetical protein